MQDLANDSYFFIAREVQQDPVIVFGPWMLPPFLVTLQAFLDEPEMTSALPDYVRPPVWMPSQKFTHRFLFACPALCISLAQQLVFIRGPSSAPRALWVHRMF
jgi:hypothetical protein